MNIEQIGRHIDRLRHAQGLSLKKLSRLAGLGETTVRDIVNARSGSVTLRSLDGIARVLGYGDGLAMLMDRPPVDVELLRDALAETLDYNRSDGMHWDAAQLARRVAAIYQTCDLPKEERRPGDLRRALAAIAHYEKPGVE